MSTYSHDIGKDYILLVLKGLIQSTASYSAETLEVPTHTLSLSDDGWLSGASADVVTPQINPHMINLSVTTLEENISKLSSVIQLYLDVITASAAHLPLYCTLRSPTPHALVWLFLP